MITARKRRAPITVPAIAAIETPFEGGGVVEGLEVFDVDPFDVVGVDGGLDVDVGEFELRQVASSEDVTVSISEHPPGRP
jgi:hypothetical protein